VPNQPEDAELSRKYMLIKYLLLLLRGGVSVTFCSCKAKNCSMTFECPLKLLISYKKQNERFRKDEITYSLSTVSHINNTYYRITESQNGRGLNVINKLILIMTMRHN